MFAVYLYYREPYPGKDKDSLYLFVNLKYVYICIILLPNIMCYFLKKL